MARKKIYPMPEVLPMGQARARTTYDASHPEVPIPQTCDECGQKFADGEIHRRTLQNKHVHLVDCAVYVPQVFTCRECGQKFPTQQGRESETGGYIEHTITAHGAVYRVM